MKKISFIFFLLFFMVSFASFLPQAQAKCTCTNGPSNAKSPDECKEPECTWTDDPSGSATCSGDKCATLDNPININTPQQFIGRIISVIFGLVGSIALLMFVYGGLLWMTSQGNDKQVSKGKATLTWAAIGIVVIFSSYALVNFIINNAIRGN